MKILFHKTGELNISSYVQFPLRSSGVLNIENKYFICLILAHLQPFEKNYRNRVSNYRHYFNELNIKGFDFKNEFKCTDVHKIEKLNILSIKIIELIFYPVSDRWKQN